MKIANVLVSGSWGDVSPEAFEKGIGGREGALLNLSREWAKAGHQVTSFVNIEKHQRIEEQTEVDSYHEYIPVELTKSILENFPYDVVIAWECPSIFNNEAIQENVKLKLTHLQCANFPSNKEQEFAELYCDYAVGLSPWHKDYMLHDGLRMDREKVLYFPNGINIDKYPLKEKLLKKPWRFVYSSSPDRGLWQLLQCWPEIRLLDHEAELIVTYGVNKWVEQLKWTHVRQGEMAIEIERLMQQEGIVDFGKVGQTKLAKLQLTATAWPYPLDAMAPTETGCITAMENMAAGNPVITTNCDCMAEEFQEAALIVPLPFDAEEFTAAMEYTLTDEDFYHQLQTFGYEFAQKRQWKDIAPLWLDFFQNELH